MLGLTRGRMRSLLKMIATEMFFPIVKRDFGMYEEFLKRITIPLVNDQATGYRPSELGWQIKELANESRNSVVRWSEHEKIADLLD